MTAPITWAEATSPILWSNIGIDWNTPAKGNSATFAQAVGGTGAQELGPIGFSIAFGADVGQTFVVVPTKPVAITMALTAAQAVGHNHTMAESAIYGADLTSSVTDRLDAVESVTFATTADDTKTGLLNVPVSATYAVNSGFTDSGFITLNPSATFATDLTQTSADKLTARSSVTWRVDADYAPIGNATYPNSITFAVTDTSNLSPHPTYTDEPIYTVTMGIGGSTSFLWNEEDDVTTTWTKVDYPN